MKKKILYIALLGFVWVIPASAQDEYKSFASLDAGFSSIKSGYVLKSGLNYGYTGSYPYSDSYKTSTVMPVIALSYDFRVIEMLSVGAGVSYQKMSAEHVGNSYYDSSNKYIIEDFTTDIAKLNYGARFLFHYLRKDKVNLSSGIRFGMNNWSYSTASGDTNYVYFLDRYYTGTDFTFQVIALNFMAFFTDNIGFNTEVGIGHPYYIALGLTGRF